MSRPEGESTRPVVGWTEQDIPSLIGRTFVVTGANSGLGFQTTKALAARHAHVIMGVRDEEKGQAALAQLREELPEASLEVRQVDLADLDTVHTFAQGIRKADVLINNAGVMMPPHTLTAQGNELQFGVNHLAHFVLTGLLLDVLKQSPEPRVVTVSSLMHKRGRIHFDDLAGEHKYSRSGYYAQSKLANVVFGLELHRRLRENGFSVMSVLAHPGYSATNLQSAGPSGLPKLLMKVSNRMIAQDARMGALPQLYAATHPDVESGQFIGPNARNESRGYPTLVEPLEAARDRELAKRVWDVSEQLTGLHFDLSAR